MHTSLSPNQQQSDLCPIKDNVDGLKPSLWKPDQDDAFATKMTESLNFPRDTVLASRPRITFLDLDSLAPGDLDLSPLRTLPAETRFYEWTAPDEVLARCQEADIAISNKAPLSAETLTRCGRLKMVCIAATGTNNIDLEAARRLGIAVSNVRNYGTPSVVQHVFTLMFALQTHLLEYQQAVRNGEWGHSRQFCLFKSPFRELAGKTLGIVGWGTLGQAVGKAAEAFGMRVLTAQRPGSPAQPGRVPLHDLLAQVDVLSLHCPLTDATRNLIGADELARMKPEALLINTARGGIVDETALAHALRAGLLGGAGMDVLAEEPPVHGNPLLAADIPNLIVTPHIAWASQEARQRMVDQIAENIRAYLAGQPRNLVP